MLALTSLMPWQERAVDKLAPIKVGALYMEQGTGKTRTMLELILRRYNAGKISKVLWLCPFSAQHATRDEISKHFGFVPSFILVRGIESLSSSARLYLKLMSYIGERIYLVVDESNLVKNIRAIRTDRVIELSRRCRYKAILNGTPVTRNESDLFAQWYILDYRILGYKSFWSFSANHLEYDDKFPGKVRRVLNVPYLTRKIAPYTYQVTKEECLKDLPPKYYVTATCEMSYDQAIAYHNAKMEFLPDFEDFRPESIYKLFSALQNVLSGYAILSGRNQPLRKEWIFEDPLEHPRIQTLLEYLPDEKTIIFCKYTHEIKTLAKLLQGKGCKVAEFYGEISPKKRVEQLAYFKDEANYLLANKACAGYALNLQFCKSMMFYNNDFDYGTRAQAEDRIHRIGQTSEVKIIDIVTRRSIDELIYDCLRRKENLVDRFRTELYRQKDRSKILDWMDGTHEQYG